MHSLLEFIFWIAVALIAHTYLIYPLFMVIGFKDSGNSPIAFKEDEDLPQLAILIAAYNEEKVIAAKIHSVFNSSYPKSKLQVIVGSDASTDKTDALVQELCLKYTNLKLVQFKGRVGKIGIINQLVKDHSKAILVLTDANVLFKHETLFELIKWFKDEQVGLVAANIIKESKTNEGISFQEKTYLSFENLIKSAESRAFKIIMGAEGGCFALRQTLFTEVPSNFIVDDFYITLKVMNQNKHTLFNPLALCSEDVSSDSKGEYKRKVRISSGNFQNLMRYKKLLMPKLNGVSFAFFSHKVFRWLTPFLLIFCFLSTIGLLFHYPVFKILLVIQALGFVSPLIALIFPIKISILKYISHFYLMNYGFIKRVCDIFERY